MSELELTEEEREVKRLVVEEKLSVRAIADILGVHYNRVDRIKGKIGLRDPNRKPRTPREKIAKDALKLLETPELAVARRLLAAGEDWPTIRNVTGLSYDILRQAFPLRFPKK